METARKNVTEISQFARARGKNGGAGRGPLDECREISTLRLAEALGESLELLSGQLLRTAEKAAGLEMYHLYMDAMELARDRVGPVTAAFREHFLWRFNRECRRESDPDRADVLAPELSLLEPDDLETSLAAGTLANAIFNACSEELYGLGKRMGLLVNDPDLLRGDNPVGPDVIGKAILEALEEQESPIKVRLLLVSLLSRHLPERVRDIYREINRKLVERNVLPTIRVGLKRQSPPAGLSGQTGAPGSMGSMGSMGLMGSMGTGQEQVAGVGGGDLFAVLQQMMSGRYGVGAPPGQAVAGMPCIGGSFIPGPAMPGEPAGAPVSAMAGVTGNEGQAVIQPGTFLYALNQLQHGHPEGIALSGVDAAVIGGGQVNVLRSLRGGGMAGMMNSLDAMTLDIVAMVFDYILGDDRIPDAIKALIGRLQIPVLKVAMLDKSFFSQKNHPARRLLDALAESAIGWDPAEGHESGLYRKIDGLVTGVLERFDDSLGVFDEARADLDAYLAVEKSAADTAAALSAQVVKTREQADMGRRMAHAEVESALLGHPVPAAIRVFLSEHWANLLTGLHRKVGTDSQTWTGAVATMTDLVWSVAPKVNVEERRQLVAMLPSLLKRVDEGVQCLGLGAAIRDDFFSSLVKCHAEAVKAGLLDVGEKIPAVVAMEAEDAIPVLDRAADFEPVEPVEASVEADPDLVEEMAEAVLPIAEEIAIQALEWNEDDALASLKRGSWIAYRQDDGVEVRAKLSWVSPLKGVYLFTNRQGQRAMSINADGLAAKLRAGDARVIDAAPLMERAVGSLMEQLQRNAA